jgi:hypothetical protein
VYRRITGKNQLKKLIRVPLLFNTLRCFILRVFIYLLSRTFVINIRNHDMFIYFTMYIINVTFYFADIWLNVIYLTSRQM